MNMKMDLLKTACSACGVNAAFQSAAASETGQGCWWRTSRGGRDRTMAPFTGIAAILVDQLPINDETTAHARAQNDAKDHAMANACDQVRLPQWQNSRRHWRW